MKRVRTCGNCRLRVTAPTAGDETVICGASGLVRGVRARCTLGMHEFAGEQLTIDDRRDA